MKKCNLCARKCNIDRNEKAGYCGMNDELVIARAALHMWEEGCISGEEGSGTVFFSGCSLKCIYCQNNKIALNRSGHAVSITELADIFIDLQNQKANNINLVTPTHYVPQITQAIRIAREKGLNIPIVYNTGTYETEETIEQLAGYVDVYLADFKYMDEELAFSYSNAKDYPQVAKKAIWKMYEQIGKPVFDERGMMIKGLLIRHLVLPGHAKDSKQIIRYLYETYGDDIYISIMNQYTPLKQVAAHPLLGRSVTEEEYDEVVDYAIEIGVENGFIQEGETAKESFIPEFE